jgi:hypothetical protein
VVVPVSSAESCPFSGRIYLVGSVVVVACLPASTACVSDSSACLQCFETCPEFAVF